MPKYRTNELEFHIPDTLQDNTHHIFGQRGENSDNFDLVVNRSQLIAGETFPQYCERLLSELQRTLSQFELQFHRFVVVAGQPSWAIDYRWNSNGQQLHQRQINLSYTSVDGCPMVVQFTASVVGEFSGQCSKTFMDIVSSVSLCEPGALV